MLLLCWLVLWDVVSLYSLGSLDTPTGLEVAASPCLWSPSVGSRKAHLTWHTFSPNTMGYIVFNNEKIKITGLNYRIELISTASVFGYGLANQVWQDKPVTNRGNGTETLCTTAAASLQLWHSLQDERVISLTNMYFLGLAMIWLLLFLQDGDIMVFKLKYKDKDHILKILI